MFKEGEILSLNAEMKAYPFPNNGVIQDVVISRFDEDYSVGNIQYYLKNLALTLSGIPFERDADDLTSDGKPVDYSKVKLVIIESLSRVFDMMFFEIEGGVDPKLAKDKRNVYGEFQSACTLFMRRLISLPIPKIVISLEDETQDENLQLWHTAYVPGKKLSGKIESYFTIALYSSINRNVQKFSERYRVQTQSYGGNIAKTPLGMFNESELFIENDMKSILERVFAYYGKGLNDYWRFPDILLTGASGSGKSSSLRTLV